MRLLALALCACAGCLPAYDNMFMGATVGDGGAPDLLGANAGSGKMLSGVAVDIEDVKFGPGQTVHFAGIDDPRFVSMPTDSSGRFSVEIPQSILGSSTYLVVEGSYQGQSILRTDYLPRMVMDGSSANMNLAVHYFKNQDDMMGVRGLIASSLVTHGDVPAGTDFVANYSFQYGYLVQFSNLGFHVYQGYSVQLSVDGDGGQMILDQNNCKPDQQCCLYYAYDYNAYINTPAASRPATLLDFGATTSPKAFAVVCPASETGDITLQQTAPLSQIFEQSTGQHPTKPFPTITAPRIAGDGVLVFWQSP